MRERALLRYTYIACLGPITYVAVHSDMTKIRIRILPITDVPWSLSRQDTGPPAGKISIYSVYFMLSLTVEWASSVSTVAVTTEEGGEVLCTRRTLLAG